MIRVRTPAMRNDCVGMQISMQNLTEGIIIDAHSGVSRIMAELGRAQCSSQEIMCGPFNTRSKQIVNAHGDVQGALDTFNKELEGGQNIGCKSWRCLEVRFELGAVVELGRQGHARWFIVRHHR
jgi:hypothetical protein